MANPNGQVGLAHARWSDEHQVVPVVDKAEVQQGTDLALGDGGLVPVVEGLQMFLRGELRLLEVAVHAAAGAGVKLMLDQRLGKVQVGQLIGLCPGQQSGQLTSGRAEAQATELRDGAVEQAHGVTPWPVDWPTWRKRSGRRD